MSYIMFIKKNIYVLCYMSYVFINVYYCTVCLFPQKSEMIPRSSRSSRSRSWRSCIAPSRMARQSLSGKSFRYHTYLFPYIHNNSYLNVYIWMYIFEWIYLNIYIYIHTICVCECGAIANCPRLGHALYTSTSRRATFHLRYHFSPRCTTTRCGTRRQGFVALVVIPYGS